MAERPNNTWGGAVIGVAVVLLAAFLGLMAFLVISCDQFGKCL